MAKAWVVLVVLGLALQAAALPLSKKKEQQIAAQRSKKFDWNHGTVGSIVKPLSSNDMPAPRTLWKGYWFRNPINTNPGGHNFATRRAVDFVLAKARAHTDVAAKVTKILRASLDNLDKDKEGTEKAVSHLVLGNYQTELRVNIDGTGAGPALAALAIRRYYGTDREVTPDGTHSAWWKAETGYASANPIHAMLEATSDATKNANTYTQKNTYDLMVTFAREMITDAITLLTQEKDGTGDTANWAKGLRRIGSVLHTIQDSACSCTPRHWTIKVGFNRYSSEAYAATCLFGDGHSVVKYVPELNRWMITAMSDSTFYNSRHGYHASLDTLYEPGRVLDISVLAGAANRAAINVAYDNTPTALWGDNDPAYDGGYLLLDVISAAVAGSDPASTATKLVQKYLEARYISWRDLKMPTIQESTKMKEDAQKKH